MVFLFDIDYSGLSFLMIVKRFFCPTKSASPPAEGSIATWQDLRQPCVPSKVALRLISAVTGFSSVFS
ncbi:hypothetical protein EU77_05345 [Mesotoga sp. SC_NapDC]|nr:hypothetical protein EU77_05345 [Mesotoga sp. SC_NapDC]